MNYHSISSDSLKRAAQILCDGGLVAFPTETVYGLGADAFNPSALAKVFEAKNRPHFDPLIVHIAEIEMLENVADLSLLNDEARKKLFLLAENLWPGPLSIILPKNKKIPALATSGLDTAAIRFPDHPVAQKLIILSTGAVAAPSANPFGSLSPTRAEHVRDKLGDKVDMILDGGSTRIGLESTVLDITGENIRILRPGGTPRDLIEKLIGFIPINNEQLKANNEQESFASPGMLKSHYAPTKPLFVLNKTQIIEQTYEKGDAFLFFDTSTKNDWLKKHLPALNSVGFSAETVVTRTLSESKQPLEAAREAAAGLFETLHELDKCQMSLSQKLRTSGSVSFETGFRKSVINAAFPFKSKEAVPKTEVLGQPQITRIFAQFAPSEGLGEAINDRLQRASSA